MSKQGKASAEVFLPWVYRSVIPVGGTPASANGKSTSAAESQRISTNEETVLFCIDKNNNCKIGLPPAAEGDNYHRRAMELGKLENVSHVFFNPGGEMFVVRGHELYKGPTPSARWNDWFQLAKCVGSGIWDQFKFLFFSPGGILYAVTKPGVFYKGPEPSNKHISWLHKQATVIGGGDWQYFDALIFDPEGIMYGVWFDLLRKNPPVTNILGEWAVTSVIVGKGWRNYSYFMGFSYDGDLWCVSNNNGIMYSAPPPTQPDYPWIDRAQRMGSDYRTYKHMKFTQDKTIQKVLTLDFLLDDGKILETQPEVVALQEYNNKGSTSPLKCTFEINKTCVAETQFTHEHGFTFGLDAETTFKAKIPFVGEAGTSISATTSTSHTWNFATVNRIETHYKTSSTFDLLPGKAVQQKAVVHRATIDVPYMAEIITVFGYKTIVTGIWKGASYFNLKVLQVDI
ncbi:hypothetical protein NDU88_006906 [Pleurodeles waltl]|uniref:Tachylectin 2 domain-containing protein n=1 Tax=Pleurodeles waltl TaxID=8319 RepID=A0AAV7WBX7_PLEWA|nr:hypothetical protein NDU88_006906 [Pleurodeles waltl]